MTKTVGLSFDKLIELKHADISYGDKTILQGVNMHLSAGEFCYLFGKTGSGKSMLLKTLYGDLPLQKGEGKVVDFDLSELDYMNKHLFRRRLGIIFQDYFLFKTLNVYENLDYILRALSWPDKEIRQQRIKEVLMDVGLVKKIYSKVYELSGGEQQRVAIARSIINNPSLLIADEPAGKLDMESADELMFLLQNISKKHRTAVLFATHDERIMKKFPARAYKCEDGRVSDSE